jgi:hypothetical protein
MTAMSPNFHVQTFAMIFFSIQLVAGTCMFQEEQVLVVHFPRQVINAGPQQLQQVC